MINNLVSKQGKLLKRKRSIRKKVIGNAQCPRLTVRRSIRHIYAQVIDDGTGKTLVEASTMSKEILEVVKGLKKREAAEKVGELLAERCIQKEITRIVFDRNGRVYTGRIAGLADAARKKGLSF